MFEAEVLTEKVKGCSLILMIDVSWIEVGLLASSGAIGSLLVWGWQNWLKG